jgi:hypothetical protein
MLESSVLGEGARFAGITWASCWCGVLGLAVLLGGRAPTCSGDDLGDVPVEHLTESALVAADAAPVATGALVEYQQQRQLVKIVIQLLALGFVRGAWLRAWLSTTTFQPVVLGCARVRLGTRHDVS